MVDVDILKIYFGDPYEITDNITVYQPSIQEIIDYGEDDFYSMLYVFIGNTTLRRLFLWENGIDWNTMTDYELFCSLVRMFPPEKTSILFGDLDFTGFDMYERTDYQPEPDDPDKKLTKNEKRLKKFREFEAKYTFYNKDQQIELSADTYHKMAEVLRYTFSSFPKAEYTFGKTAKEFIIEEEKNKAEMSKKEETPSSTLQPLISFCVNHPGFKYRKDELRDVKINELMDSVQRLQIWEQTHALMGGCYSGFCDTSKIPREQFDFMRQIRRK